MNRKAAIRQSADGFTYERWDNFTQEWHSLPLYWTKRRAIEFTASICGVQPKDVALEARAARAA
jgi:hypothetical protein